MANRLLQLIKEIEDWSHVYDFTFQFWGEENNNVYISKDGIDMADFGGEDTIEAILQRAIEWVKQKNPEGFKSLSPKPSRCPSCGSLLGEAILVCNACEKEIQDDLDFDYST